MLHFYTYFVSGDKADLSFSLPHASAKLQIMTTPCEQFPDCQDSQCNCHLLSFFFTLFKAFDNLQVVTKMILSPKIQLNHFFFFKENYYVADLYFFTACIKLYRLHQLEKKMHRKSKLYVFGNKGKIGNSKLLQQK